MGITPQQLQQLQARLARRHRGRREAPEPQTPVRQTGAVVVLGLDPSLRGTGYGVLRAEKTGVVVLTHGTIRCPAAWPRTRCLARIGQTLRRLVRAHRPDVCVVEGLFYAQNLKTALILGEARGAALAAVADAGLEVYELAPRKVKQAIVGYGAARKEAVGRMVQRLLGLRELPAPDAADALALALAHAQETHRHGLAPRHRI